MRFLLDMGISPLTQKFLTARGHEAVHLADLGMARLQDAEILAKAAAEGRILVTHDLDFADLLAATRAQLPTVVTFRLRDMRPDHVNRYLDHILRHFRDPLEQGALLSVTERRVRFRPLPLED